MNKESKAASSMALAAVTSACVVLGTIAATLGMSGGIKNAVAQAAPTQPSAQKIAPPDSASDPAVARGHYVALTADCVACHTAAHSRQPFAGGYPLETPFGTLVSSNITQDKETGIGAWSEAQFARAVREGRGRHGENLYPAMPYNAYAKMSDQDIADLWAYMKTIKPVHQKVISNQLPFPFNIRLMMSGWNLLFFDNTRFKADPTRSIEWNRGAYLVQGAGHCAACHSAKNFLGGDIKSKYLEGGQLPGWYAPEITNDAWLGLGHWSEAEVVEYLKIGSNAHSVAAGPMAEAVTNSTQHVNDGDLHAIAVYLKTLPGSNTPRPVPLAAGEASMKLGQQVFSANCAACHDARGTGVATMVTSFAGNPSIQAPNTDTIVRAVLEGNRGAVTQGNPTGAGMPAFGWKLSDEQIAAVLTYARNSWGNAATAVSAESVMTMRKQINSQPQLTYSRH
jgi:mono/diheme cytochrome c family protein